MDSRELMNSTIEKLDIVSEFTSAGFIGRMYCKEPNESRDASIDLFRDYDLIDLFEQLKPYVSKIESAMKNSRKRSLSIDLLTAVGNKIQHIDTELYTGEYTDNKYQP